jgi:hypothetical protein
LKGFAVQKSHTADRSQFGRKSGLEKARASERSLLNLRIGTESGEIEAPHGPTVDESVVTDPTDGRRQRNAFERCAGREQTRWDVCLTEDHLPQKFALEKNTGFQAQAGISGEIDRRKAALSEGFLSNETIRRKAVEVKCPKRLSPIKGLLFNPFQS